MVLSNNDITISALLPNQSVPWELLLTADPAKEIIQSYLSNSTIYVACDAAQVIGAYVLHPNSKIEIEIKNIAVAKAYQRQGVGRQMIKDAIARASQLGYLLMVVGTGNSSLEQIYFYQRCGFRMTEVVANYFINYPQPLIENGIRCLDMLRFTLHLNNVQTGVDALPISHRLAEIQRNLTPLQAAYKIQEYAAQQGFDWANPQDVLENIASEVNEILEEVGLPVRDQARIQDEFSDLLYGVINLSRHLNVDLTVVLNYACLKFMRRFAKVEEQAIESGRMMSSIDIDELMQYWANAKKILQLKEMDDG